MADHFLETPEYEQSKILGLVYLKGAESVKRITSKYKFRWLIGQGPARPLSRPPLTKIPGSAPVSIYLFCLILLVLPLFLYICFDT